MLTMFNMRKFPPIHDITTDVDNPPDYTVAKRLRSRWQNSLKYEGKRIAELQRRAYPDIRPVYSTLSPEQVFAKALGICEELGWKILDANTLTGQIEAFAITPICRFRDDIVICIRPQTNRTCIDIRSASRIGRSDLGTNARRIRTFIQHFEQEL